MPTIRLRHAAALAASAAALATAPTALASAQAPPARCAGLPQLPTARCGSVVVPLDRARPQLGTTTVAYALVPRRRQAQPSHGTIVYNPGGPGDAPIANGARIAAGLAPLLDRRELLLIDPRGTGRSDALRCAQASDPALPFLSRERFTAAVGACGRALGARAGAYGTEAAADDFEAVRAALGIERLDLWGESYGSYLMTVLAARHPEHVRSIVLSGAYPIAFDPWGRDRLRAAKRAIRRVCARSGDCRGGRVLDDLATVAARLRRAPVMTHVTVAGRRHALRIDEGALAALVYANGDAAAYRHLPAALRRAAAGDLAGVRQLAVRDRLRMAGLLADPRSARFFSAAQSFAAQCRDYPRAFSYADTPAVRRSSHLAALSALDPRDFAPFSPAGWEAAGFEAPDTCIAWPGSEGDGPLAAPQALPTVPTLVLAGGLDANTPSAAGREAAAQFPDAVFVEVAGAGHVPTATRCGVRLAITFVRAQRIDVDACR